MVAVLFLGLAVLLLSACSDEMEDVYKRQFNTYPYEVVTYAKLSIIREKSVTERSLVTRGRLLNSTRSDNNPHGFILEAFRVVENRDCLLYTSRCV